MYISITYLLLLIAVIVIYYLLPVRMRWVALLPGSILFYLMEDLRGFPMLIAAVTVAYAGSLMIKKTLAGNHPVILRRGIFIAFILITLFLLFFSRACLPVLGISFFSLQIIAYLTDIYLGRTEPEKNYLKFLLFITFFPQIVQGPIPRYDLMDRLYKGHTFEEKGVVEGFMMVLWGFFLKLVIADRAGVFVDMVYSDLPRFNGTCVLLAGILYSVQLYTDFSSCVSIAMGSARMLGIRLDDNFCRPYFAVSVKDFWRRWHMTLSRFLRDYVYIPLGGNRHGKLRKYFNIMTTFLISGLWHGNGLHFIFWGFMHGAYQIAEDILSPIGNIKGLRNIADLHFRIVRVMKTGFTFFLIMLAWIMFRAESLKKGLFMILSVFTDADPGIFTKGFILPERFSNTDMPILFIATGILFVSSLLKERGIRIKDSILRYPAFIRGAVYLMGIISVIIFGQYGSGFDPGSFIYAGF